MNTDPPCLNLANGGGLIRIKAQIRLEEIRQGVVTRRCRIPDEKRGFAQ